MYRVCCDDVYWGFEKILTVGFQEKRKDREARTLHRAPAIWILRTQKARTWHYPVTKCILAHWAWGGGAGPEVDRILTSWFWGGENLGRQNNIPERCGFFPKGRQRTDRTYRMWLSVLNCQPQSISDRDVEWISTEYIFEVEERNQNMACPWSRFWTWWGRKE